MTDYGELVKALRICTGKDDNLSCIDCPYHEHYPGSCHYETSSDAAAAIEALQAEVQSYKALADEWQASAENKERLLGLYRAELYRAEPTKHFYSATDNNGRVIQNPCACMNIPVFPDSSESPNS